MKDALGDVSNAMGTFRDIAAEAFGAVAAAAQQVLATFTLTGKGGAFALKKLTADIIAALAIQSAVKAVFELAEGFAALANPITAWQHPSILPPPSSTRLLPEWPRVRVLRLVRPGVLVVLRADWVVPVEPGLVVNNRHQKNRHWVSET